MADLPGPVQALIPSRPTQRHYTRFDQVNQLVGASEADPDLGFMARMLVLCSLPRTNPGNRLQYKRTNGPYSLIMTATGNHKLPFGNLPRLILAWVCSEAVHTPAPQSNEAALGCTVSMIYENERGEVRVSSLVADRTVFWWNERKPDERSLWQSKIELGEKFFNEIINHPVPLNMNALNALKRSALGLDLYLWLVYRTFPLRAPKRLTWRLLYSQFGAHPDKASDNNTVQAFRYKVLRELKKIKMTWPELNYSTAKGVLILHPSTPTIAPLNQGQLTS